MRPITVWRVLSSDNKYEHNHIEFGHVDGNKPIGKFENQNASWKHRGWWKLFAYLTPHKIIYEKENS